MIWSQTLIPTRRERPAGAKAASHQLLVRAGLVREQAPGVIEFLPLGLRVLGKLQSVTREELSRAGLWEIELPPQASDAVVRERITAALTSRTHVPSRAFGFRTRADDAPKHSFLKPSMTPVCEGYAIGRRDQNAGADDVLRWGYEQIVSRLGLPVYAVDAGNDLQAAPDADYIVPGPTGDDVFLQFRDYAATPDRAETGSRPWTFGEDPVGDLEKVHTPGLKTVAEVAAFFAVPRDAILKTLVFRTNAQGPALSSGTNAQWVAAVVRGDDRINFAKLARVVRETFHVSPLPLSDEKTDSGLGSDWPIGFVGPDAAMRKHDAVLVVDYDAARGASWVAGASETDHHYRHFNWFRECGDRLADPRKTAIADIRYARAGDPAPNGAGVLVAVNGFQVGRAAAIGADASLPNQAPGARDGSNGSVAVALASVDLFRLLIAAIELSHDDQGILWPPAIAPFSVVVTALGYNGAIRAAADRIHDQLNAVGIDTILDDRDASAGAKFADADLIGFPVRVTIGQRGLKEGLVEMKARGNTEAVRVPVESAVEAVRRALK